jgi:hypothetical protein
MLPVLVAWLLLHHAACAAPQPTTPQHSNSSVHQDALWSRLASENGDDDHRAPIIAVLNSKKLLMTRFRHVCTQQASEPSNTNTKGPDVPVECWRLKAACKRIFVSSIVGEYLVERRLVELRSLEARMIDARLISPGCWLRLTVQEMACQLSCTCRSVLCACRHCRALHSPAAVRPAKVCRHRRDCIHHTRQPSECGGWLQSHWVGSHYGIMAAIWPALVCVPRMIQVSQALSI